MIPFWVALAAGRGEVVTVSGASISHSDSGASAQAGVKFNSDGTVDKQELVTFTQINPTTDWIIPANDFGGIYYISWTDDSRTVNGGIFSEPFASSGGTNWQPLTSNRLWTVTNSSNAASQWVITIRISGDAGLTTLASNTYTLDVDNSP